MSTIGWTLFGASMLIFAYKGYRALVARAERERAALYAQGGEVVPHGKDNVVPLDDLLHEQDSAEAYDDLPEQVSTAAVMGITNIEVSDEPPAEVMDTIRRLTAGTRNMLITQADYDALPELDPDVTYLIIGEVQRVDNEEAFSFSLDFEVTNPEAFRAAFDPQMVSHLRSDVCGEIAADEAKTITDEWERLATRPANEWPGGAS